MKLKYTILALFFIVGFNLFAQENYKEKWEQVEAFQKDNLPKSALNVVEGILKQSLSQKNQQQAIKAMVYRSQFKQEIDNSTSPELIKDFESLLASDSSSVEEALIHSLLAELYERYYDSDSWKINQRTPITGYIPADIREWSKNIFQDKILSELDESLQNRDVLLKTKTESYSTVVTLGDDSRTLFPTMYDFLVARALDRLEEIPNDEQLSAELAKCSLTLADVAKSVSGFISLDFGGSKTSFLIQALKFQQGLLSSLEQRGLKNSLLLADLARVKFLSKNSAEFARKYNLEALLTLEKANETNPFVVYVIQDIAEYYGSTEINAGKKYEWLKKGISLYPDNKRSDRLKNMLMEMEQPEASFLGKEACYPNDKKKISLSYKNLNRVTLRIFKYVRDSAALKVKEYSVDLHPKALYISENQMIILDVDAIGNYYAELSFDKEYSGENQKFDFSVTKLISLNKQIKENEYSVFVTDRQSGKPQRNALVSIYFRDKDDKNIFVKSSQTDENGLVQFNTPDKKNGRAYYYKIALKNDAPNIYTPLTSYYYFRKQGTSENQKNVQHLTLLTDRSVYRPGQSVCFKLIATEGANGVNSLLVNTSFNVKLFDANRKEVAQKNVVTNEFGSSSGEFVLPQGVLNGHFSIGVESKAYTYFAVEEYKRPTFQVTFDKVEKTYKFDEEVSLKGHAENFSGVKLQNAKVAYTVTRQRLNFWRWNSSYNNQSQIEQEEVKTAVDGSFVVNFTPSRDDDDDALTDDDEIRYLPDAYLFTVKATVTDQNGETQSEEYYVRVSDVSMLLNVDLEGKYEKDSERDILVNATNLDGNQIKAEGSYAVYTLNNSDSIANEVLTGHFVSGLQSELKLKLKDLPSGKYRIVLNAADSSGNEVKGQSDFILYSVSDKWPPYKTNDWLVEKNTQIAPAKPVEVILGVADKDVYVLYELTKGYNVLESKIVKLSEENHRFVLPYKREYEENTSMSFTLIRDAEMIQHRIQITKPEESKELNLKFEVFRDKLRPGQKEEWRILVKDAKGRPSASELLASMYDQSLNKISPMIPWNMQLSQKQGELYYPLYSLDNSSSDNYLYSSFDLKYLTVEDWKFDQFNWFGYNSFGGRLYSMLDGRIAGISVMQRDIKIRGTSSLSEPLNEVVVGYGVAKKEKSQGATNDIVDDNTGTGNRSASQVRMNFNETAFFYPQLRTNEKGETLVSFTVPESNTTWKFRALAYDKNLNSGQLEATVVTRKELMVTPNLPRFVRVGDKASVSTKISNLSDKAITGTVKVEFFNPITNQILDLHIADSVQIFNLSKDGSSSASWTFVVPDNYEVLGCRIVANNETFSDGEQHVIPVLLDKMLVTESLPLYVRGGQTNHFTFDHLVNNWSSSMTNQRLTLEFSANPVWYAVQALPTLSNPDNDNAVNWFASYYVNTLGSFIPKQYPRVASMIETWKRQGGTKETLYSALQKNEDLKNVLLQETPWVLDAKTETEQKQSLSLLFDMNRSQSLTSVSIQKLADLQTDKGSWSWCKGFYPNRNITQYILYGFAQLANLNAVTYDDNLKQMQVNAISCLDEQIVNDFANLKKYDKNWASLKAISTNQLEYLYVRSFYPDISLDKEALAAVKFYTSVVERYWTKINLYEQSLLAVLSKKNGNKVLMNKIMASIREHATTSDEMGMFWANNKSSVFFSQSAVTVHTFLMDAFRECGATPTELDNLKLWLLKQKQTQQWESTPATLSAIYALISNSTDWLASRGEFEIHLGKTKVDTSEQEIGTGYLKHTWEKAEVRPDMGRVSVTKSDDGPAYGALYWQYFEKVGNIQGQSNKQLAVTKMLFKEISSEKGKMLQQITAGDRLRIGDKVVIRLVVRADRDMDFVQLKDMRASCFEPIDQVSSIQWNQGTSYYQTSKDASTNFYFDHLPKGVYTFEYGVYVNRVGEYSNGITSIQCLYAPEFVAHTEGVAVTVE